jgi:GNAT superfamily N-acetyltransferase
MNEGTFSIRRMNRSEIDLAVDWAAEEGWNPGLHDAECFYAADPDGFFIVLLDEEPVAMISAVKYEDSYGFMGFYIVKPEVRNRGYGMRLWDEGLKYLGDRIIGADSVRPDLVVQQKPQYRPAHINFRFQWIKNEEWQTSPEVIELSNAPFPMISEYDFKMFAFPREDFLKCWISRSGAVALGVRNGDELAAYGVIRECREGFKIGPLFADNKDLADILFRALTKGVGMGVPVFLDAPKINPEAVSLAQNYGMTEVFRTTRMYVKSEPKLPLDKWFGVTTFELG